MYKLSEYQYEKMLEAIIFCMDLSMSKITDDEEYSEKVDLQNELRETLAELRQEGTVEK